MKSPTLPAVGDTYYGESMVTPAGHMRAFKLSRCAQCHAVHPWARKPIIRTWECPQCSFPCAPPEERYVRLRLPGVLGWIVDRLYGLGDSLNRAAERLKS